MVDVTHRLKALGFTAYEAQAYLALLGAADSNGYEVAKASGVPRANVYPVLERLVERGAASRFETPAGKRYTAMPAERLLGRLDKTHQRNLAAARTALADVGTAGGGKPVFNLGGRDELLVRARALLGEAESTVLIALQPGEAAELVRDLAAVRARGVEITTLCMEACAVECGGCAGDIHRYCLADGDARWFLMVVDGERMIAGEMRADGAHAVASDQPLIVELTAAYIRQSLALATLGGALGERFEGLVSERARRILDGLHPEGGFIGWVRHVTADEAT